MSAATPEEKASWPAPNYVNPESCGNIVIGMAAPTLALVVVFASVRFYGRGVVRHALGKDDWIMLAATLCAIPVTVFALGSLNHGLGLHMWDQKKEWHTPYSKMAFAGDILFALTVGLTKVSMCLTYLRLFPSRTDKIFCYVMGTFVTLYTVACVFLTLFQCKPIRGYWDSSVVFTCIDMKSTLMSVAGLNSLSDFLIYLWPAKALWNLQLPRKQRLGLICLFAVGSLVCIAGILRTYYLDVYFRGTDLLWNATPVYALMTLEMNLGIICCCLSEVRPVIVAVFPSVFGSSYRSPSYETPHGYGGQSRTRRGGGSKGSQPFPFHPLSDVSNTSKMRDQKFETVAVPDDSLNPENREQRNFAWASAGGVAAEDVEIPSNAIQVQTVVMRDVENVSPVYRSPATRSLKGDGESEEWIMEEVPKRPEKVRTCG